jgi:trehalose/maltose hydrolase-like predicted phosphorylase
VADNQKAQDNRMSSSVAVTDGPTGALDRRFEAVVLDWDAAVGGRPDERESLARLVERLASSGLDVALVTRGSTEAVAVDLTAADAGRVLIAVDPGPGLVELTPAGVREVAADGADAVARVLADLWSRGVDAGSVLVVAADVGALRPVLEDQVRRREADEPPYVDPPPPWRVDIAGFDPQLERVHESLLTLADGRIGTRGSPLVGNGATAPTVLHAGVYDGTGPETELAHLPHWSRLAEGEELRPTRRLLDLRTGLVSEEGPVTSVRFSSLARPGTVAVRARGERALLPSAGRRLARGAVNLAVRDHRPDDPAAGLGSDAGSAGLGSDAGSAGLGSDAGSAGGHRLERLGAYDRDPAVAEAALAAAEKAGFDALLREHREQWARRWAEADIVLEGDPELQRDIRFTLFHLMAAVGTVGEAAVGARGLSGPAYRGHVFWDSDVFVLPFLAATHPAAARAMLEYRVRRLDAARELARRYDRAGARFPWESAEDGLDVTPTSARMPTGEVVRVRTGEMEEHITADVAWAASVYLDWTGDAAFAAGPGRDLIVETARYWASRVRRDREGRAHIYGVIGPDEYHVPVDDNAFTNVMARWNLRRAAAVDGVDAAERAEWLATADSLVDGYDPGTRLYEQFAGFHGLEPIIIADIAPSRPIAADVLLGFDRTSQAQVIKQADVLMLHHLVPDEVDPDSLVPNMDYYEPRTSHGSSLSPAIQAALLARAGRLDDAVRWLRMAARMDLDDLTSSTAGGLHMATMGGLWQALAFGFAGVRNHGDRLTVDPRLPSGWDALRLNLRYRDVPFRLHVEHGGVSVDSEALELLRVDDHWEVVLR